MDPREWGGERTKRFSRWQQTADCPEGREAERRPGAACATGCRGAAAPSLVPSTCWRYRSISAVTPSCVAPGWGAEIEA